MLLDASVPRHVSAHITACFYWAFVFVRPVSSVTIITIICFVSVHFSFSKTAIFRNILFMCIGGWIYSLDSEPSKPKKRQMKGTTRAINCTLFSFLKCERILFQDLSEQTNIDIEYVVIYCLHLQVFCVFCLSVWGLV